MAKRKGPLKSEKSKERILQAAISLFAKKGFHGSRVDELASKARINKERIYAYFGSKAVLFKASLLRVYSDSAANDAKLLDLKESDIPNLGRLILSHYMKMYKERPEFWRMISWANLETSSLPSALHDIKAESLGHLKGLYSKGQSDGTFNPSLPFETYIFTLWAVTFFLHSNHKTLEISLPCVASDSFFDSTLMKLAPALQRNIP